MAADELPSDTVNRIADAIEDIERNVSRLRELQDVSRKEYMDEDRQDLRDAVERKFVKLAEAILDISETILDQERESFPDRRKAKTRALAKEGLIDDELAIALLDAIEFRDVLAHTYGPVVNDDIVYDALQQDYKRYVEFVEAIDEYLSG